MIPRPLQICSYLCNPPVTGFSPAPFHSIESVDNLISIEDRDEPVHCLRGVKWTWRVVISEDAPGILHRSQYSLLIRVVHGARLLSADSIRFPSDRSYQVGGAHPLASKAAGSRWRAPICVFTNGTDGRSSAY